MSAIYEAIGRLVVGYVRRRYRTELRAAALVGAAGVALGAYLAAKPRDDGDSRAERA